MDYPGLEASLLHLSAAEHGDAAVLEMEKAVPFVKLWLQRGDGDGDRSLALFAQLAGEAVFFIRFSDVLDELVSEGFIARSRADELLRSCPANRWM